MASAVSSGFDSFSSHGKASSSNNFGRGHGSRLCTNCGRTSHTVEYCYDLYGFPRAHWVTPSEDVRQVTPSVPATVTISAKEYQRLCYTVLGRTQLQKLAHEVRVPSRLYTSYYFGTQAMWDFASQLDMFGYATDETPERMPLSHVLATKLAACLAIVRKNGTCSWLRPDGKTQVTIEYFSDNGAMVPIWVHTVVISTRHDETVTKYKIEAGLMEHVIKHVIPRKYLDEKTIYHLNHSGLFVIGGPCSDAGVTGRKIVIDTYGGWGSHGGGAFFGKDPTKLDRSGAYLCRQVAKSIVNNRLARRCSVQVAYVPSVSEPSSLFVDAYGTGKIPHMEILKIVKENFDFRPGMIAIKLDLKRGGNGRFSKTAVYGHFGRDDPDFTWEVVKLLKMGETPSVKFLQFK